MENKTHVPIKVHLLVIKEKNQKQLCFWFHFILFYFKNYLFKKSLNFGYLRTLKIINTMPIL